MHASSKPLRTEWVDPDDAPELTEEFFERATPMIGGVTVAPETAKAEFARRIGRPPSSSPLKVPTTIRFDADVLAALKATGKGWQTRVNAAMREWVKAHPAK